MTPTALLFASFSLSGLVANLSGTLVVSDTSQATLSRSPELERNELDLETLPFGELSLQLDRSSLSVGYGPRFLLRDALENKDTLVLHVVHGTYAYTALRHRLALTLTGTFGRDSLSVPALLPPAPGTPAAAATPAPAAAPAPADATGTDAAPPVAQPQALRLQQSINAQSAEIRYSYNAPRFAFTLAERGELSRQSLASRALASPVAAGTIAPTLDATATEIDLLNRRGVKTGSEVTSAGVDYAWSRRLRSSFSLSYGITGGFGNEAEQLVPQQRTAAGGSSLIYALTKHDDLATTVAASETEVSNGSDAWLVVLSEGWNRAWTPDVGSSVTAGVGVTSSGNDQSPERDVGIEPTAAASVNAVLLRGGQTTTFSVHAATSVSPSVNSLSGELQTAVGADTGAELRVDQTSLTADATILQTLPPDRQGSARAIGAGVAASERVAEFLFLAAQYRSIWQHVEGSMDADGAASLPRLWSAIFTVAVVGPAVDF